jgi:type II secretory pathway pseudopilin PulG
MIKNKNKKSGFTLIELLIAISIFMGFMIVASNAYVEIIRAQKTANETRLIYSELRNFVDLINNELREGTVDYFCYNSQELIKDLDFNQVALTRCFDTLNIDAGNNLRTISRDGLSSSIIKFIPVAADGSGGKLCQMRFRNSNGSWQREDDGESSTGSSDSGCGAYKELAFGNLAIKDLRLEIYPLKDPKSVSAQKELANQLQPMVRMKLQVGSKLGNVKFNLQYQTAITARN